MKKVNFLIIAAVMIAALGCGGGKKADGVYVGQPISEFISIFEKRFKIENISIQELGDDYHAYEVFENGERLFAVQFNPDNPDIVDAIWIYSSRIKNDKGIGVGSTLSQIKSKYQIEWMGGDLGTVLVEGFDGAFQFGSDPADDDKVYRIKLALPELILTTDKRIIARNPSGKDSAQTSAWDENGGSAENIDALQYGGVYKFGDDPAEARGGAAYIYPKNENTLLFNLNVNIGAPSYNMGFISGQVAVSNGQGVYRKNFDWGTADCVLRFEFKENTLTVTQEQTEDGHECGFGNRVSINDVFRRTSSEIPQSYPSGDGQMIYFSEWKDEEEDTAMRFFRIQSGNTYTFEGNVGGSAVHLSISVPRDDAYLYGNYYYTRYQTKILLDGANGAGADEILLAEYIDGRHNGKFIGTIFTDAAEQIRFEGTWTDASNTRRTDFKLTHISTETFEILAAQPFQEQLAGFTYIKTAEELMYLYYNEEVSEEGNQKLSIEDVDFGAGFHEITLIHEGLLDDSMYAQKIVMSARQTGQTWEIVEIKRNWRCRAGRGHQDWGTALCR